MGTPEFVERYRQIDLIDIWLISDHVLSKCATCNSTG